MQRRTFSQTLSRATNLFAAAALVIGLSGAAARAQVTTTKVGNPIWEPVDFHIFTAPAGTFESGFAEFVQTITSLLPEPNHHFHPDLGGPGPGVPHAGPYDGELAQGVAANGYLEATSFHVSAFALPRAVYVAWMNVPSAVAPLGLSPDSNFGPIIPNELFPMSVAGTALRNGAIWDPFIGTFSRAPLTEINPPFAVEGDSHFPIFYADAKEFGPDVPPAAAYEYRVEMRDTTGSGWDISAKFQVTAHKR